MIAFSDKIEKILMERGISRLKFEKDTGIARQFFYRMKNHRHHKVTVLAISAYLETPIKELIKGTNLEYEWE